jgi:IPT/TIG domain
MTVRPLLLGLVLGSIVALAGCKEDTKLRVNGVEPETGDAEGGSYVRIFGNRFIADGARNAKVYFGSHLGTVVRFASDSELIVQSPGGKPGDIVDITVQFEPGGEIKIQKEAYENKKGFQFVEKKYRQPGVDDLNIKKDEKK